MKVYAIDKDGTFLNEHNCQKDPEGTGFLYPPFYTLIDPPIGDFEKLTLKNNKWEAVKVRTMQEKYDDGDYDPGIGFKVVDNKIVVMTNLERLENNLITFLDYKELFKNECKNYAQTSIYISYPPHKQTNLLTDSQYYLSALAYELGKSIENVGLDANIIVLSKKNIEDVILMRENLSSLDITKITNASPENLRVKHDAYYRVILESIIARRLVNHVRNWCNAKLEEIDKCSTVESISMVAISDCPEI